MECGAVNDNGLHEVMRLKKVGPQLVELLGKGKNMSLLRFQTPPTIPRMLSASYLQTRK